MSIYKIMIAACLVSACSTQDNSSASLTDHEASHCEVFVDKAVVNTSSHAYTEMHLFVKVDQERLDGAIKEVGIRSLVTDSAGICPNEQSPYCSEIGVWSDKKASPFFSEDYYKLRLVLSGNSMPTLRHEGAVYVLTDRGTYYWTKAESQSNFVVDNAFARRYSEATGSSASYGNYDLSSKPKTADAYQALNPAGCR